MPAIDPMEAEAADDQRQVREAQIRRKMDLSSKPAAVQAARGEMAACPSLATRGRA